MKIKAYNGTKDLTALKLESNGIYVTEDCDNNLFAITRTKKELCKYTCIYGATFFIFDEKELDAIYSAINSMAESNGDNISTLGEVIKDGCSYNKYNSKSGRYLVGAIKDRALLGDIKLYCTKRKNNQYYFLEQNGRRLGGTLSDWNRTVYDLLELKENYGVWERSM